MGAPAPIGAAGIVRFTSDLQRAWEYSSEPNSPASPVADCYALNLDGQSLWACYYTDFPVVQIHGEVLRAWTNDVPGAKAIAVRSDQVWLAGGYPPERDRLVTGELRKGRLVARHTGRLVLPDGSELPEQAMVTGQSSRLQVLHGQDWFIIDP